MDKATMRLPGWTTVGLLCLTQTARTQDLHKEREGHGVPIVLLPGSPGSVRDFRIPAPGSRSLFDLLKESHTVLAVDPPGHGESKCEAGNLDESVAAIGTALQSEKLTQRPFVLGYSWGAVLASAYATKYPERVAGLVLVSPVVYADPTLLETTESIPAINEIPFVGGMLAGLSDALMPGLSLLEVEDTGEDASKTRMVRIPYHVDKELNKGWVQGSFKASGSVAIDLRTFASIASDTISARLKKAFAPDEVPPAYMAYACEVRSSPERVRAMSRDATAIVNGDLASHAEALTALKVPCLIIYGEKDDYVRPKMHALRLATVMSSQPVMRPVPAAGHALVVSHPQAVHARIVEWLASATKEK